MLILGVGNVFRGDDAAGILAARRLAQRLPQARVRECDGDLTAALDAWNGEDCVYVVDAVASGATVGTIHRFAAHADPLPACVFRGSTHAFGIADAVEMARALGQLPQQVIVYGIEASGFEQGQPLSPAVAVVVDEVVDRIVKEVASDA